VNCRSQRPRGLRRRSAAGCLLGLWFRIPLVAWMFVCCECCVLTSRSLCDELITRPEESYRLRCVVVFDLETSWMRRPWFTGGCSAKNKQTDKWIRKCVEGKFSALICGTDLEYFWSDCTCRRPRKPFVVVVMPPSWCSNQTLTRINVRLVMMWLGSHPVVVVQYTCIHTHTHKQYTERHKTNLWLLETYVSVTEFVHCCDEDEAGDYLCDDFLGSGI
jgi:hypothetical protein